MHSTNPIREVFYKIRVLLHPNYLPGTEGTFQARTVNEGKSNSVLIPGWYNKPYQLGI